MREIRIFGFLLPIFIVSLVTIFGIESIIAQPSQWATYTDDNRGISFEYPSSWIVQEIQNSFDNSYDLIASNNQQTFIYRDPIENITHFEVFVNGHEFGNSILASKMNLQTIEKFNLDKYCIDNRKTAAGTTIFDSPDGKRITEQTLFVYDGNQVHTLKYRDIASNFDSPESQSIMNHILKSFKLMKPSSTSQNCDKFNVP